MMMVVSMSRRHCTGSCIILRIGMSQNQFTPIAGNFEKTTPHILCFISKHIMYIVGTQNVILPLLLCWALATSVIPDHCIFSSRRLQVCCSCDHRLLKNGIHMPMVCRISYVKIISQPAAVISYNSDSQIIDHVLNNYVAPLCKWHIKPTSGIEDYCIYCICTEILWAFSIASIQETVNNLFQW